MSNALLDRPEAEVEKKVVRPLPTLPKSGYAPATKFHRMPTKAATSKPKSNSRSKIPAVVFLVFSAFLFGATGVYAMTSPETRKELGIPEGFIQLGVMMLGLVSMIIAGMVHAWTSSIANRHSKRP